MSAKPPKMPDIDPGCFPQMPADRCPTCGSERAEVRPSIGMTAHPSSFDYPCDNEAFHGRSDEGKTSTAAVGYKLWLAQYENQPVQPDPVKAAHEAIDEMQQMDYRYETGSRRFREAAKAAHAALDAAVEGARAGWRAHPETPMTDTRTPGQIAKEQRLLVDAAMMDLSRAAQCLNPESWSAQRVSFSRLGIGLTTAIDRAILAARWAQHVEDCHRCKTYHTIGKYLYECATGDRLRREWEEASK